VYNVRNISKKADKRRVPSERKIIIELWFFFNQSIPLLVDAERILTEESPIQEKMRDFSIFELEEYLKYRKKNNIESQELPPPKEKKKRKKVPRSVNLWKKYCDPKERESLTMEELVYMETQFIKKKVEKYTEAAQIRDFISLRLNNELNK
jgi:hypothetical protein